MKIEAQRELFEQTKQIYESVRLRFRGVDGYDVYNPSVPFTWHGVRYIFGRMERRKEWARSWVRLFSETGPDEWTLVPDSMIYQLEDPFISVVRGTLVLGGTHVRFRQGKIDTYYGYFYRGADVNDLFYFTTGPDHMKDIRLVELMDGRIGVFSRPSGEEIRKKYGSASSIGFAGVDSLDDLNDSAIQNAAPIEGLFGEGEWGGCNQCYRLGSGLLGIVGHKSYLGHDAGGNEQRVYMNMSFVFDPKSHRAEDVKIIGTRSCYPEGPAKRPYLSDCVFTSGIVMRPDGKADLYSGMGDTEVGRITIDYPFAGYGEIL